MKKNKSFSYAKYGYLFSIPFVVVYAIFSLYPTINTALLGFTNAKGLTGLTDWEFLEWGSLFKNFQQVLNLITSTYSYAASGLLPGSSPHGKSPAAPSKLCGGRFPLLYQQTAQRASAAFILAAERPSCMAFSSAQNERACRPLRAGDKPSVSLIRFYCAISARKLSVNPGQLHAPHP